MDHRRSSGPEWAHHLRRADPTKPLLDAKDPSQIEGQDEQQWGQQKLLRFVTAGTGLFAQTAPQLVQATRPARVWSVTVAFSVLGISDPTLVHAPNGTLTATFILQVGVGQVMVKSYVQLFDTNLVAFAPDPTFPLKTDVPIASTTLVNIPARQVVVSAQVLYNRILIGGPANLDVLVAAEVAPVYR